MKIRALWLDFIVVRSVCRKLSHYPNIVGGVTISNGFVLFYYYGGSVPSIRLLLTSIGAGLRGHVRLDQPCQLGAHKTVDISNGVTAVDNIQFGFFVEDPPSLELRFHQL